MLLVQQSKDFGNGNARRTAVHAVAAGGAGDAVLCLVKGAYLIDDFMFFLAERNEICHKGKVIFYLGHIAHTGEHHGNALEAGGIADGIACGAGAHQFQCFPGQVHQAAALHRLHDQHRLTVLAADLVALAAFHPGIFVVCVVKLDLHKFHFRVPGQEFVQECCTVVEGKAQMTDFPLCLQLLGDLVRTSPRVEFIPLCADSVKQVKIKIVYAAGFQLILEEGEDLLFCVKAATGKLVCQHIAFPGITIYKALPDSQLAFALNVGVGGVEIVKAGG